MLQLMKRLKPYTGWVILAFLLLLGQAFADLYIPTLNAKIINEGIAQNNMTVVWQTGAWMLLATVALALCALVVTYSASRISMRFGRDVRRELFAKVQTFSQQEVDKFGASSLITRNTNDVNQVQMVIMMGLRMMASAPIMAIGGAIMAMRQDVKLSSILLVILPLMALCMAWMLTKASPLFEHVQKRLDRLNQVMREKLSGVRVIRAFVRTGFEEARFDKANRDHADMSFKVAKVMSFGFPMITVLFSFASLAVMWFGAQRIEAGSMQLGNLTAFTSYVMQIMGAAMTAIMMFIMLPRAITSARRINEVLETQPQMQDAEQTKAFQGRGFLEFDNVGFRYPDAEEAVLSNISFTARPGETTAIIGSTGSGKSTLINLAPRFFDVTEGCIRLDGVDIREMTQETLHARIGYVPQKAFLFTGTVADNLRFGQPEATEEEMWRALNVAQAGFVKDMEGQLDASISQGGSNVSGGQRQRLAIARALIGGREVYIFDDSFSALDFKTDAALRSALAAEIHDSTVLIVAQRVSTVLHADRIVVLDNGQIAGLGTHSELMNSCDVYREIVRSQLSEEEIA